jgi:hypothetical protein
MLKFKVSYSVIFYTQHRHGTLTEGRFSTADLLTKVACFVKRVNDMFNIKII